MTRLTESELRLGLLLRLEEITGRREEEVLYLESAISLSTMKFTVYLLLLTRNLSMELTDSFLESVADSLSRTAA